METIKQRFSNWIQRTFKSKSVWPTYPTVSGGFDIFRNFVWGDGTMSKTKMLQTYQKSMYVFACVSKTAKKVASIDWELYKIKNRVGDTQEIFVHEALDLLYRPNPFQTKTEFFEKYMINKLLAGEAYILKVRDNAGNVVEMWNLRPDHVRIIKDSELFIKAYEFTKDDGTTVIFKPEDVIRDAYPSPLDEYGGISALHSSEARVSTEEFATKYQKNFFLNNARPDFIISTEGMIDQEQKDEIKEKFEKRHKGFKKGGLGAFFEGGIKYQQVSISQREMDYIESLKMTRDDILVAFGVPKPIVAITEDVNYANAETAMKVFLSETVVPEINRLTEKLNENLIYPEYGDVYFIEYENPVPENKKEKAELQQIQIQSGVLLINEAREDWGLTPIQGGWSLYKPLSEVPVGGMPQGRTGKSISNKKRIFRGKSNAYKFLELKEQIEKTMYKALVKDLKKHKENEERKGKALILPEIRDQYAGMVIKAIDNKSASFKDKLNDFFSQQEKRVLTELKKTSKSVKAVNGLFDKTKENKLLAKFSLPFITEFVESAGKEALGIVAPAEEFDTTDRMQKYIKQRTEEMASQVNSTTIDKLARTIAEGVDAGEGINQIGDRVSAVYDEFPLWRADMIARTEVTSANNYGFISGYEQSGVANAKEWIATFDDRTRDSHAEIDGEIVKLDENFSNGLEYPGDPAGDPAETINCRCVLGPAFLE